MRGLSILQLLDGQKGPALESMRYAYRLNPYGLYMSEAFIIALCENDLRDEATAVLESIVKEGFVIEDDFQAYLDGKTSLKQYYIDYID